MYIFCDLDGVLIDSRNECLEILKNIFPNEIKKKNYKYNFYLNRGLVDPPEDFLILNNLISKISIKKKICKKDFYKYKKNISKNELENFKNKFFDTRKIIINKNFNNWIKLNTITPFAKRLRKYKLLNIIIITTKNFEASLSICKFFKFNFKKIISNENLKERTKGDSIREYLDLNRIEKAIFIDDSNKHLITCKDKRVIRLFADWGYNKSSIYKKFELSYFEKLINV